MINPKGEAIQGILDQPFHFAVPKYQRAYAWGMTEALEFYEDLKSCSGTENAPLFLGTLIFNVSKIGEKQVVLVDGQQRLTTILLLLIAWRIGEETQCESRYKNPR